MGMAGSHGHGEDDGTVPWLARGYVVLGREWGDGRRVVACELKESRGKRVED